VQGLALRLLGPPSIDVDGAPLHVDTRKAVALLTYVALEGPQRRESLSSLLWPESTDTRARAALRRTLSVLNRALGNRWLQVDGALVGLTGDRWSCDVAEFLDAVTVTGAHGHDTMSGCGTCMETLQRAADLYRGEFLSGFGLRDSAEFDAWMMIQAETLRRESSVVLERLVDALTDAGRLDAAIARSRRLVTLDPLHEPAHRRLMQLYAWNDRRADAIHQYRECVATLDRELGVRPLDETTALYQAIVSDRVPPRPTAARPEAATTRPAPARPPATGEPARPPHPETPMVGRDDALAALLSAYARIDGEGRLLAVTGEAGIGKTRLVTEVTGRLTDEGATVLAVRCQPGDQQLAYAPVAEALRDALTREDAGTWLDSLPDHWRAEAGRLVPGIHAAGDHPPPEPLSSPGAQARFVEGVWRVLGAALDGDRPGVLVVDDLQWADAATLQLLRYVITRLRGRRLALLCAWRSDELDADHPWIEGVQRAADDGLATLLTLRRLAVDDIAALLRATGGGADVGPLAERLHRESEGLPLAVVAYLDDLDGPSPSGEWPLPRGLGQLFRRRVANLDEAARQVLTAAAAIGRSFDFDTVMAASGRTDSETVSALETLTGRGMVREVRNPSGEPVYDFTHDKLRSVVYAETSLARRRLLHGRVADALHTRVRAPEPEFALAGRIAHHEQLAGREQRAAQLYAAAGEQARALYANREALAHLRRALALGHPDAPRLHEAVGDLETLVGDYRGALASFETAAAAVPPGSHELAVLEHKSARVHLRTGDAVAARARLDAALAALGDTAEPGLRARIAADRSLAAERMGSANEAELDARRALDLAERAHDRRALAQARNILGLLARRAGRLHEAERQLEHSAGLAASLDEPDAQITALNNLALVLGAAHRYDHALEHAATAADLCERIGDRHRQAALHNNIADLLHAAGRDDEAMTHLTRAVTLFAEVGEQAGSEPEIWKLVDW
jgi:DNA-binding SARP family transcriptional activator